MIRLLYVFCFVLLIVGCKQQEAAKEDYTGYSLSGYPYIHHISNPGPKPEVNDVVYFQVRQFGDGVLIEESRKSQNVPRLVIPADSLIDIRDRPIIEGLKLMSVGDSLQLDFNLNLLPAKPVVFEKVTILRFDIVLLDILSQEEYDRKIEEEQASYLAGIESNQIRAPEIEQLTHDMAGVLVNGSEDFEVITRPRGLKYVIIEEGDGPQVVLGSRVFVSFCGALENGAIFDNSFRDGRPYVFNYQIGSVIRGWFELFSDFRQGTKAVLYVPYQLAYGVAGDPPRIPESANLVFYVELEEVR